MEIDCISIHTERNIHTYKRHTFQMLKNRQLKGMDIFGGSDFHMLKKNLHFLLLLLIFHVKSVWECRTHNRKCQKAAHSAWAEAHQHHCTSGAASHQRSLSWNKKKRIKYEGKLTSESNALKHPICKNQHKTALQLKRSVGHWSNKDKLII